MSPVDPDRSKAGKAALRDRMLAARRQLLPVDLVTSAAALAENLLSAPEVARAAVVATYVSVGREPGTGPLLDGLTERGIRVLLPVLRRDAELDWAPYAGPSALAPALLGLLEPTTGRLGPDAVVTADAVLCPGLAVDRRGRRLGRGGGSYDRALARSPAQTFRCVLVYDGEVVDDVPVDLWDQPVDAAATPGGLLRFRR